MKTFIPMFAVVLCALLSACNQTPESAATPAGDATPTAPPEAVTADPEHYSVLFENDVAAIIRAKFPAGAKSVMHSHPASCGIIWRDQRFKSTPLSGEPQTSDTHAGEVSCGEAYSHLPENVGSGEAELVLIHFKNRKTFDNVQTGRGITITSHPKVADSVTADPAHYAVQFENDVVRLIRVKLRPGEKTPMHAHPAHCSIQLLDTSGPDAAGKIVETKAGTVACEDAAAHEGVNEGKTPIEFIAVEFKNRDKFKS